MKSFFVLGLVVFIFFACHAEKSAGGNSLETENTLAFEFLDSAGKPLIDSTIKIMLKVRPENFYQDTILTENCETCFDIEVQKLDDFQIKNIPNGHYIVEGIANVKKEILRGFATLNTESDNKKTIHFSQTGGISGYLNLPVGCQYGWVQMRGLSHLAKSDSSGYFFMDSLPIGTLQLRATAGTAVLAELQVSPNASKILDLGYLGRPVNFDSSEVDTVAKVLDLPLAAFDIAELISDWMQPLYDSTVVTLHLDSTFEFSSVGNDLSVLKLSLNEKSLAYSVPYYDVDKQKAVVQVRVPVADIQNGSALFLSLGEGRFTKDIWEGIPDSVRLKLSSVEFGDFSSGTMNACFPSPIVARDFYLASSDSTKMYFALDSAALPRTGASGHFVYVSEDSVWVMLGVSLNGYRDFNLLDSVAFWAKGSGIVSFAFEKSEAEVSGKNLAKFALTSEWKRYVFEPSELLTADGFSDNIEWDAMKDSVSNISIFGNDGSDLWIDGITFYGISRDDLK